MKKNMLGTSDAWSMSRSSQQPSKPAYYIEDCRISRERKREREGFFSLKRANTFEWTISSVSNGRKAMKGNQRNLQFYLACCQTTFYLHFTP